MKYFREGIHLVLCVGRVLYARVIDIHFTRSCDVFVHSVTILHAYVCIHRVQAPRVREPAIFFCVDIVASAVPLIIVCRVTPHAHLSSSHTRWPTRVLVAFDHM